MKIIRVGLDVPVTHIFDYAAHDASEADVGQRAIVPFGKRVAIGVILEVADSTSVSVPRLKTATRILRDTPALSADDLRLLHFAADYYHHPLGRVVMSALPQRLRRAVTTPPAEFRYLLTTAGRAVTAADLPGRAVVKHKLLEALRLEPALDRARLKQLAPTAMQALKGFIARGWVERTAAIENDGLTRACQSKPQQPTLTPSQRSAVDAICAALDRFQPVLLVGVTGSGKTEVYLRVAEEVLRANRQVLLLVPEIALTPQLEAMVQGRFPNIQLASLHSGLNETERLRSWLSAQSGRARIVLGTRLAIFTPLPHLGLIVVDEEQDASFKQAEGFCYSARDLAVVRASHRRIPVVLGSATPALESYQNAMSARYMLLELPERINALPPCIEYIALERSKIEDGLHPRLLEAIAGRLERGEQSLVFINRRGYAPVLMCHSCGWLSGCHRCSAQLVLHLPARELHCHHCGYQARVPGACPQCGNPALAPIGQGTQRVEAALARHFPAARVLRIDRDSTRRKHAWANMRERIRDREVDILVGTQILAKGHDFPNLALVGVLNADAMLYSSDFRASERLYALLTQVAGRAGRGQAQGEVLIQTEFPEHPLYTALSAQNLAQFARVLLAERQLARFPPFVHQVLLRAEASQIGVALEFLENAKKKAADIDTGVELFDAVPATMMRLAGRERAQLLAQSASRTDLHAFLRAWRERLAAEKSNPVRWALEVDPLEL